MSGKTLQAQIVELNNKKIDKSNNQGLSDNNFTNDYKNKVDDSFQKSSDTLDDISDGSDNKHFTDTEKTKLSNIGDSADNTAGTIGVAIHDSANKNPILDADRVSFSENSTKSSKYITWAQIKSIFAILYASLNGSLSSNFSAQKLVLPGKVFFSFNGSGLYGDPNDSKIKLSVIGLDNGSTKKSLEIEYRLGSTSSSANGNNSIGRIIYYWSGSNAPTAVTIYSNDGNITITPTTISGSQFDIDIETTSSLNVFTLNVEITDRSPSSITATATVISK